MRRNLIERITLLPASDQPILVTGGAGYIGAHVVRLLVEQGHQVVVVDDLSTGSAERVGPAELVRIDVSDPSATAELIQLIQDYHVGSVVHLAARKQVPESVSRPGWYYRQNVGGMTNLLSAMEQTGVDQLVFSSSAAVYGGQTEGLVEEDRVPAPINPYGETKLIGEWMGRAASRAWGLRFIALRYFNVAGAASPDLADPAVLNLVTIVLDQISRGLSPVVFGDDFPTSDGTCVRDFIHVSDLARAHVAAISYLSRESRPYDVFNVGTGIGYSVREVISELARVGGVEIVPEIGARRPGDPASVVASPERINRILDWQATAGLGETISSAWEAWRMSPRVAA